MRDAALKANPNTCQWTCIVCGKFNDEPVGGCNDPSSLIGILGDESNLKVHIRTDIESQLKKPICSHCGTSIDYTPPLNSLHLFKHAPERYLAFSNYPIRRKINPISASPSSSFLSSCLYYVYSLRKSPLYRNITTRLPRDWRLPLYLSSQMPEPMRYSFSPALTTSTATFSSDSSSTQRRDSISKGFQEGELVECRVQKVEWTVAKVLLVREEGMVDIVYESGEEVRFVSQQYIRTRTCKLAYAYQVEIAFSFSLLLFPISLLLTALTSYTYAIYLCPFLFGLHLLCYRIGLLFLHIRDFYDAGIKSILCINFSLALPYILSLSACFLATSTTAPYSKTAAFTLLSISLWMIVLQIYFLKPFFALLLTIEVIPFLFTGYLLSGKEDGMVSMAKASYFTCMVPAILSVVCMFRVRKYLLASVNVSLVIRPLPK